MRVFALSDLHVDHEPNARWVERLPGGDYRHDVLLLAGDVSHSLHRLQWTFETLVPRFRKVLYVPGNHELWVPEHDATSLEKLEQVLALAAACGVGTSAYQDESVAFFPLFGWYDYSFGAPSEELFALWSDYRFCRWPADISAADVAALFMARNVDRAELEPGPAVSFSHFVPRADLLPSTSRWSSLLLPVIGTSALERQIRALESAVHVYGHSHSNRDVTVDGIRYVNNALGYPLERGVSTRGLLYVYES